MSRLHQLLLCTVMGCFVLVLFVGRAEADLYSFQFNDPPYVGGSLSGQDGWAGSTNPMVGAGDLTASALTNFALTQSGTGQSIGSPDGTSSGNAVANQVLSTSLTGTVWFSALLQPGDSSTRVGLGFNSTATGSGAPRILALNDDLFVGSGGSNGNTSTGGNQFTIGTTSLLLGQIEIDADGSNDHLRIWVDPDVTNLGATTPYESFDNFLGGSSISAISVHSYGSGSAGLFDLFSISNDPTAFFDVTGLAPPTTSAWTNTGSGDWGDAGNWNTPTFPDGGASVLLGDAITAAATVNLDVSPTVGVITIDNANAYTVSGSGTLSLSGFASINVVQGTHSITSTVAGESGLTKTGNGTLVLSGSNSYTGTTNISAGALRVANSNAVSSDIRFGAAARLELSNGVTLNQSLALPGRSDNAPIVGNFADNNSLTGAVALQDGGNYYGFDSQSGTWTMSGDITAPDDGARTIVLSGAGDGVLSGKIIDVDELTYVNPNINVTKRGSGTWTIGTGTANADEFHQGATLIEAGTLAVKSNSPGGTDGELRSSAITVRENATFDVSDFSTYSMQAGQVLEGGGTVAVSSGGTFSIFADNEVSPGDSAGTLTIDGNVSMGAVFPGFDRLGLNYELAETLTVGGGVNDLIQVNGNLTTTGANMPININPLGITLANGSYRLIDYSGTYTGSAADFSINHETRFTFTVDTSTSGQINLDVSGSNKNLTWVGNISDAWNLKNTANFTDGVAAEQFFDADNVTFDESASSFNVAVTGTLKPGAVVVSGAADYTFAGDGSIAGGTGLTKSGSGRLTISNANSYGGVTNIAAGVLHADNNDALGSIAGQTVANGGALDITGSRLDGEVIHIQGAGSDGRGALYTEGFDALGGGERQLTNVVQDGDATIAAYFEPGDPSPEFAANDYRWDLEPGGGFAASWEGNGHDLVKKGRGVVSIVAVGEMNVPNFLIEEGQLYLQGNTTSTGGTITVGVGNELQSDYTGNPVLSFFNNNASSGPQTPNATHFMNYVLDGGVLDGGGGGSVTELIYDGPVQLNDVNGTVEVDNEILASGSATMRMKQSISGPGGVRYRGGMIELQADNTYTGNTEIAEGATVSLVGSALISASPRITVEASSVLDVTGRISGSYTMGSGQTVDIQGNITGNISAAAGSVVQGSIDNSGTATGTITGNLTAESGSIIRLNTGAGIGTTAFVQNASDTIGANSSTYLAFEAESYTRYNDVSGFNWDVVDNATDYGSNPTPASENQALVASGAQDGGFQTGNDDTALYDVVFTEPGEYFWYVRTAAPGGQNDSFFGPASDADTTNTSVAPGSGMSRFGVGDSLLDSTGAGGDVGQSWEWLRANTANSFVGFEKVVVTADDVANETIFTLAFEPRQLEATLDKMVLVNAAAFDGIGDSDLDGAINAMTAMVDPPLLTFAVDGDFTMEAGATLEVGLRGDNDVDNMSVSGTASLNGSVSVMLEDGFVPNVGDTFTVLTGGTVNDLGLSVAGSSFDLFVNTGVSGSVVLEYLGSSLVCDFDGDGLCDINDIDALTMELSVGGMDLTFDVNGDGMVNYDDLTEWLVAAGAENLSSGNAYLIGDADLDGVVDVIDFNTWNQNKFTVTGKWSQGDFTADGATDVSDFNEWNNNKFQSALDGGANVVPEPSGALLLMLSLAAWVGLCRRR